MRSHRYSQTTEVGRARLLSLALKDRRMFGGIGLCNLETVNPNTNKETDDPDKELLCSFTGTNIMCRSMASGSTTTVPVMEGNLPWCSFMVFRITACAGPLRRAIWKPTMMSLCRICAATAFHS